MRFTEHMGQKAALLLLLVTSVEPVVAQRVRPMRDSVGFCWDAVQMERLVSYLESQEESKSVPQSFVAGISPHDDFLYAARVYFPLFRSLRTKEVVIFGVTHGTVRKEIGDPQNVVVFDDYGKWMGVSGDIEPSPLRSYLKATIPGAFFQTNNGAHRLEHSIEALLPFVQYFNPGVRITPIMVTAMPFETMEIISDTLSSLIARYVRERGLVLGKDIAFLISSDANHYGRDFNNTPFGDDAEAHERGTAIDCALAGDYLVGEVSRDRICDLTHRLWGKKFTDPGETLWCGKYSVPFGVLTTLKVVQRVSGSGLQGTFLRYSDTYSGGVLPLVKTGMGLTAPFSLKHWVGFFSIGYTLAR
jgi:AmmeMemoRadiSam system protein B